MQVKRTSIFLTPTDRLAIRRLQTRYGLATMSDALRISLRLTERSLVTVSNAWWSCSDVADHLGHKNIQNTRICVQITTSLRHTRSLPSWSATPRLSGWRSVVY